MAPKGKILQHTENPWFDFLKIKQIQELQS